MPSFHSERGLTFWLFFLLILKNISGFAIKHIADGGKGGKTNSGYLIVFCIYRKLYAETPLRALPWVGFDSENAALWRFLRSG